jgi:fibronectin-binding autotransporter adhesin
MPSRARACLLTFCSLLVGVSLSAQTTTTRTDRLIASTKAIIGATTLGANTLNVTGTIGVSSDASVGGTLGVTGAATLSSTLGVTGNTILAGDLAINGNDLTSSGVLRVRPAGDLTLDPTGDVVLGPDGGDVLPDAGYRVNLGGLTNKYLTVHAAELWVETLIAQDTIATIGGSLLILPTTTLVVDILPGYSTIVVKHNNLASGDRVVLQAAGAVEYMAITSGASGSAGNYTYSVTRDLDGSGANTWYAGDAVANTGQTGNGFIDLYSTHSIKSYTEYGPTIVGNVRLSSAYADWAPRWAIGNLDGLYSYSGSTYGAAFGDPSANNLTVDATNGIRMRTGTTVLGQWSGSTLTLGQPLTSGSTGQLVIDSDSVDFNWRNASNTTTTTILQIANSSGAGIVSVTGDISVSGELRVGTRIYDGSGNLQIWAGGTGAVVEIRGGLGGGIVPYTNEGETLGNSTNRWSAVYGKAYYVGTTAGASCTSAANVTVVNGIVTGCS